MDKKWIVIIILALLITLVIIIFALISSPSTSPDSEIETCNALLENNGEVNLVFFGEGELSKKYMDFFLSTSPFNENKEKFNFYYIDSYTPECELYKGIAVLCHSKELIKKASSCPSDHIIVLSKENRNIRSSSYMNVVSINTIHPLSVLTHEFGHSYVNLAEEYIPAKIPRGSENCVSSCEEFEGIGGCFQECSDSDHVRSIENGVMRTLNSNSFGVFNELIILNKLNNVKTSRLTGKAISTPIECVKEEYYLIEGSYFESEINIVETTLEDGCIGNNGEGIFSYSLEKTSGETIPGTNFNPELIFTDLQVGEELTGETFTSEKNFFLKIPKLSNTDSMTILEDGKEIIKIPLKNVGVLACKI